MIVDVCALHATLHVCVCVYECVRQSHSECNSFAPNATSVALSFFLHFLLIDKCLHSLQTLLIRRYISGTQCIDTKMGRP